MTMDERKKIILQSIVLDYVETAEPVGSRAMVKKHGLKISAATVRNEMADLEDMGYLEQPHTSAGRIPSQKGFRYFVDCMMESQELSEQEIDLLYQMARNNVKDWEEVISGIAQFLSQITHYTSFIIMPAVHINQFRFLQLVPLEKGRAVVLLVTDMGLIMHRKIEIPESITPEELATIAEVLNRTFSAKKMGEITRSDLHTIRNDLNQRKQVLEVTLEAIDSLLESSSGERVVVSGLINLLKEPEFRDLDKLKRIVTLLEEDLVLKSVVPNEVSEQVGILIGNENPLQEMKDLSMVFTGYKSFGELGKIGLIGPVRMEYWKATGSIEAVRSIVQEIIQKYY